MGGMHCFVFDLFLVDCVIFKRGLEYEKYHFRHIKVSLKVLAHSDRSQEKLKPQREGSFCGWEGRPDENLMSGMRH